MISGISSSTSYYDTSAIQNQKKNLLEELDTDGNGSLNASEAATMAEMLSAASGNTVDADALMTELDTNSDGAISEEELTAAAPPPPAASPEETDTSMEMLVQSFMETSTEESESTDPYDTNGDGTLDAAELAAKYGSLFEEYTASSETGGLSSQVDVQV